MNSNLVTAQQVNAGRWWRTVLVLGVSAILLVGVGCQDPGKTAADVVLPPKKEEELGDELEKELLAEEDIRLYQGQTVEQYIKRLGQEAVIAAGDDSPDAIEYEFKVIDDPDTINAFAMPGGQIFFYTGLLKLADTEAEVMSVMCHEVAHVSQRHIAKRLVAAYGLQAVIGAALGENPGLVEKLVALIVAKGALLTFGRKQEKNADEVGMEYLIESGYDPHGFVTFFEKLKAQKGGLQIKWLSSHPLPEDRIENAEKRIGARKFEDAEVGEMEHKQILQAIESHTPSGDTGLPEAGFPDADRRDGGM